MSEVTHIADGDIIPTPQKVDVDVTDTEIYVSYSTLAPEGETVFDYLPPNGFTATRSEDGAVRIRDAAGREGAGHLAISVGQGVVGGSSQWNLQTTERDVVVRGFQGAPLRIGSLLAQSSVDGRVLIEHVNASQPITLSQEDAAKISYADAVTPELIIPSAG